mmetsp:Transcript_17325/g.25979  ORF Transcript_17325/g.25979 Transcript_17325/m.25979 type:complete len:250 (-) Transcript_17325:282-1031(-)
MLAVLHSLLHFLPQTRNQHVNIISDNSSVVHCLNRWGSKSPQLIRLLLLINQHCHNNHMTLSATYIHTSQNTFADSLSRDLPITSLMRHKMRLLLRHRKFQHLLWRHTRQSHRLLPHHTILSPRSLTQALNHMQVSQQPIHVIAPHWPETPWYNHLLRHLEKPPQTLPGPLMRQRHNPNFTPTWLWIGMQLSPHKKNRMHFRTQHASYKDYLQAQFNFTGTRGLDYENFQTRQLAALQRTHKILLKAKH